MPLLWKNIFNNYTWRFFHGLYSLWKNEYGLPDLQQPEKIVMLARASLFAMLWMGTLFMDIANMELSVSRMHGAKKTNVVKDYVIEKIR